MYTVQCRCAHELHKLTVATVFRCACVPHTRPRIPCSLRDDSPVVRKNTLVVLTHLILNDMIKVKGQISAMALCLEDPEQKIADLAKLFFHELSKKVSMHTLGTAKPVHINICKLLRLPGTKQAVSMITIILIPMCSSIVVCG